MKQSIMAPSKKVPTANLAVNRSRIKIYNKQGEMPTYYLQSGQEFQIELFNPTTDVIQRQQISGEYEILSNCYAFGKVFLESYEDGGNTYNSISASTLKGANPSNAFVVKYDGSATLSGDLTINSDARLKSNIVSLGSTLAKLMQIDGKSYTLKSNEKENKIGLLAQEILEVFPELVKSGMDKKETLSVNYQGLIPVLINAIKEQQNQIKIIYNEISI